MAKITKGQTRVLTDNNPKLKLNLKEIFGIDFKGQRDLKLALGQAFLDKIIENTQSKRVDRKGKALKAPYSKEYQDSLEFKAAGKTKDNVNLTLTGDMLGTIEVDETGSAVNVVELGWEESEQAAKAHGHITGAKDGPKVKRDFFGLNSESINQVKNEFKKDIEEVKKRRGEKRNEALLNLLDKARGL